MKRIFSIFLILTVFACTAFADEPGDVYEDDFVYQTNGAGDQFLKIELGAIFPLNFDGTLWPGVAATIGYYRFLNSWLALGGELAVSSQFSIGGKALFMVPITLGVMFQPSVKKFEFPIYVLAGIADQTWANFTYFPAFTMKTSAGAFYRITESWSVGLSTQFMWIAEWTEDSKKDYNGLFQNASLAARYHF